jgi:hypothetical protein
MYLLKELLFKATIIALLAAALNLTFHTAAPELTNDIIDSSSYLTEQNVVFFPFTEKSTSSVAFKTLSFQVFSFTVFRKQSLSVPGSKMATELLQHHGFHFFKEYPFIVFVRKLRI